MSLLPTRHTALVMIKQNNITVTERRVCTLTVKIFNIIYLFDYYMKLDQLHGLCSAE